MRRVLIIGGTGMLGQALVRQWDADQVSSVGSRELDIRDPNRVLDFLRTQKPDAIILAAAMTDVDECERDPQRAFDINASGAENVVKAAAQVGAHLLYVSTDFVFDGHKQSPYEPQDAVDPINVYGRSKAEGERVVRSALASACVLRTSWLFGLERPGFPSKILDASCRYGQVQVVCDQRGSPTYNRDLAVAIRSLVRVKAEGVLHASNAGQCSRFEFARELVRLAGVPAAVEPIESSKLPQAAKRPRYSVLSNTCLEAYGVSLRPWQHAARQYVEQYMKITRPRAGALHAVR